MYSSNQTAPGTEVTAAFVRGPIAKDCLGAGGWFTHNQSLAANPRPALYGLHKMMLLVEKQHNRGQDGGAWLCVLKSTKVINYLANNNFAIWRKNIQSKHKTLLRPQGLFSDPDTKPLRTFWVRI